MPRWLVTGASGFLGANVPANLPPGITAVAGTRAGSAVPGYGSSVRVDLGSAESIREALDTTRPDVVLHAAAQSSHAACEADPELAMAVNGAATGTLARGCEALGARLVYVSTDAVFDGGRGSYAEADEPRPFSAYGRSKLAGEQAALQVGSALVARVNFFGWSPSGDRSILEFFAAAGRQGHRVPGYLDYVVSSAYVADTVRAIAACVEAGRSGIVHVAASDALSKSAFGQEVLRQLGADPALVVPTPRPGGPLDLSLDVSLLRSWIGWVPRPQRAGIEAALADLR